MNFGRFSGNLLTINIFYSFFHQLKIKRPANQKKMEEEDEEEYGGSSVLEFFLRG